MQPLLAFRWTISFILEFPSTYGFFKAIVMLSRTQKKYLKKTYAKRGAQPRYQRCAPKPTRVVSAVPTTLCSGCPVNIYPECRSNVSITSNYRVTISTHFIYIQRPVEKGVTPRGGQVKQKILPIKEVGFAAVQARLCFFDVHVIFSTSFSTRASTSVESRRSLQIRARLSAKATQVKVHVLLYDQSFKSSILPDKIKGGDLKCDL